MFAALDGERPPTLLNPDRSEGLIPVADRRGRPRWAARGPTIPELRRNVRLLTTMLGDAIAESGGAELLEQVETLRKAAIAFRGAPRTLVAGASRTWSRRSTSTRAEDVIRAFTCYFQLVNLAEERHRVRTLRARSRSGRPVE